MDAELSTNTNIFYMHFSYYFLHAVPTNLNTTKN